MKRSVLGLDLGTHTGYARVDIRPEQGSCWLSGTWDNGVTRFDANSQRYTLFGHEVAVQLAMGVDIVYYEKVLRHMGTTAAHVYGGFLAKLHEVCDAKGVPYQGIAVGTIKKFVAGKGNASKDEVVAAVRLRGFDPKSEDEADAIAVALCGLEGVQPVKKPTRRTRTKS